MWLLVCFPARRCSRLSSHQPPATVPPTSFFVSSIFGTPSSLVVVVVVVRCGRATKNTPVWPRPGIHGCNVLVTVLTVHWSEGVSRHPHHLDRPPTITTSPVTQCSSYTHALPPTPPNSSPAALGRTSSGSTDALPFGIRREEVPPWYDVLPSVVSHPSQPRTNRCGRRNLDALRRATPPLSLPPTPEKEGKPDSIC